jgi:hypothetical protein
MCLTTTKGFGIVPMTAEEPTLVFKELLIAKTRPSFPAFWKTKRSYRTPFQGFDIKFSNGKCEMGDGTMDGVIMFEQKGPAECLYNDSRAYLEDGGSVAGIDGNYVYTSNYDAIWENGSVLSVSGYKFPEENIVSTTAYVFKGIHAYLKLPAVSEYIYEVKRAIIPKGAHYFIGDDGDIVADKMIIYDNEKQLRKDYDYDNLHRFDA